MMITSYPVADIVPCKHSAAYILHTLSFHLVSTSPLTDLVQQVDSLQVSLLLATHLSTCFLLTTRATTSRVTSIHISADSNLGWAEPVFCTLEAYWSLSSSFLKSLTRIHIGLVFDRDPVCFRLSVCFVEMIAGTVEWLTPPLPQLWGFTMSFRLRLFDSALWITSQIYQSYRNVPSPLRSRSLMKNTASFNVRINVMQPKNKYLF